VIQLVEILAVADMVIQLLVVEMIDDNQVTLQEEFVSQQSDIVESGTFTLKQVEIINPEEIQSSSDKITDRGEEDSPLFVNETQGEKNFKGILKRKNQDKKPHCS
jgi:hypothetical protein